MDKTPRILNKSRDPIPESSVYVGRGSPFGNPFVVGVDGTRSEVIRKYRQYVRRNPELLKLIEEQLRGRDLVCFCAPKACHAEVIFEILYSRQEQLPLL